MGNKQTEKKKLRRHRQLRIKSIVNDPIQFAKFGCNEEAVRSHVLETVVLGGVKRAARTVVSDGDKNHGVKCENCQSTPTVGFTGLCGPCCFGEASTAGGNW